MAYPIRVKDGLVFSLKNFVQKGYQKYDEVNKKFVKSPTWSEGMSPVYLFGLKDGQQIELSRATLSQCLVSAFDYSKGLLECNFVVKTNGKAGKEVRYFINQVKSEKPSYPDPVAGQEVPPTETNPNDHKIS